MVNRTPFVLVVRKGNPKRIRDFADLARPGVKVVHPDPLTSGGANWAILAEYGSAAGRSPAASARRASGTCWGSGANVAAQAASARAARTQFENGFGDVLVTYEQDVLKDAAKGTLPGEIVYPPSTVLSEHTLVVVDKNVEPSERPLIDALVRLPLERARRRGCSWSSGFRSVDERLTPPTRLSAGSADPFLVGDFGGWNRVKKEIVDGIWKDRVLKEIG